jgi:ribosomal protein S18 acetylase RimI-like enzyme
MRIRPAVSEEVADVLDLWRDAGAVPDATDTVQALEQLIDVSPDDLLVAEAEGRVVGVLVAAWDGRCGNLYRLAVAASHRRAGVGRALLNEEAPWW